MYIICQDGICEVTQQIAQKLLQEAGPTVGLVARVQVDQRKTEEFRERFMLLYEIEHPATFRSDRYLPRGNRDWE